MKADKRTSVSPATPESSNSSCSAVGRAAIATSFVTESDAPAFWPTDLSPAAREQLVGPPEPEFPFDQAGWYVVIPMEE